METPDSRHTSSQDANAAAGGGGHPPRQKAPGPDDYVRVIWAFYIALSLGLVATAALIEVRHAMMALLWAMACFVSGGALGFIFGIPKVLQGGQQLQPSESKASAPASAKSANYRQEVNTNLTEISDWLTKMIVGVTLVNLKEIPPFIKKVAQIFADAMSKSDATRDFLPYAIAVIVFFAVLGFLFGYLTTRLYLAPAFARADRDTLTPTQEEVKSTQAEVASLKSDVSMLKDIAITPSSAPKGDEPGGSVNFAEASTGQVQVTDAKAEALAAAQRALEAHSIGDAVARGRKKDQCENEIAKLVLNGLLDRDWLVAEASSRVAQGYHDGLIGGLAVAVNASPLPGDFQRLAKVAMLASWWHTRAKINVAIGRLFSVRLATKAEVPETERILSSFFRPQMDQFIKRSISETAALITQMTGVSLNLPGK